MRPSSIEPGDYVRLLVQPFFRGTVEEIREGEYETEVVVAGTNQNVITGLRYVRKVKERE